MTVRLGWMLTFFVAWTAGTLCPLAAAADSLPAKDSRDLTQAVEAWNRGDSGVALKTLSTLLTRLNDGQVELADKELAARKLPTLGKLLGGARLTLVTQGYEKSLGVPSAREAILVLPEFYAEAVALFDRLLEEPILADPLAVPGTVEGFESPLWNAHVLHNKLANAQRMARYMADLVKRVPRAQVAKLTAEQKQPLEADYQEIVERLKLYARAVEEREMELRLRRLELARDVLAKPQLTRERWFAAGAWSVDVFLLQEFLQKVKADKPLRAALQPSDLGKRIERLAGEASKSAGDLTSKVNFFNVGVHWWLRGRYGQGPEFFGLAKSQLAMRTPGGEFALIMPTEMPQPTDPTVLTSQGWGTVPQYDRRHHYWWGWESRRISRSGLHETGPATTTEKIEGDPRIKKVMVANPTNFW